MKLTVEQIRALNPYTERFDNFLQYYPDFQGTVEDFAMLENITCEDKVWVLVRLMSREQKVVFALKCASSILDIFEQKYPNDNRPRKALEAIEAYLANPTKENADAAYAYAAAAYADAYAAAAYATDTYATAAAYTAYAAAYAAYAAAYAAAAADVAYAAAYTAADAEQRELNLIFAVEVLNA